MVSLGKLLVSLDRLPTSLRRFHCTMHTVLYTKCKYTELTTNIYSYFCNIMQEYLESSVVPAAVICSTTYMGPHMCLL